MPKALTPAQIEAYRHDGFIFPIDALSPEEAAAARAAFAEEERRAWGGAGRAHDDADGREWLRRPHRRYHWAYALCMHPRVLDAVEDLLGPDVLLWDAKLWPKPASSASFVSWHQDATYVGLRPLDKVITIWLALTDSTIENGCLKAIPGTHGIGQVAHHATYAEANLLSRGQVVEAEIDEAAAVAMELRAGQFSVHHMHVLHGSAPNPSGRPRLGMSINYVTPDVRETGDDPRPAVVARGVDRFGHFEPFEAPPA
jgi:ectoine hydroxylase-related dioxygenase (phytanoyl-CoA dioxygenase family)